METPLKPTRLLEISYYNHNTTRSALKQATTGNVLQETSNLEHAQVNESLSAETHPSLTVISTHTLRYVTHFPLQY